MSTWQRISGLIEAPESRVQRVRGFLEGAQVIAQLEYDPQEPDSLWVSVATDAETHVAVLDDGGTSPVPGPPLQELALALAQECQGEVTFDETTHGAAQDSEGDEDPFDPQIGIVVVAERAVVRTRADHAGIEELATHAQSALLAVPDERGHLLLIQDGPAVGDLPLEHLEYPALVLQHAADYPALSVVHGNEEHQHVWGLTAQVVPDGSASAREFADATLGLGLLVEQIRTALPGLSQPQVRTAVEQSSDAAGAVNVLGLSPELTTEVREFLLGQRPGDDAAGALWIEPLSAGEDVRRRAQEAADEARRAAGNAADDTRRRAQDAVDDARRIAEDAWRRTDDVWRRAEGARTHSGFGPGAEEPARKWAPYLLAGAAAVGVALLWRQRSRR